jgi:type III secretion protein C
MGSRVVKMQISAQDGGFSNTSVEQLPVVKTRDIQTQAVVREGESLLIGGMVYESDTNSTIGVPGLSKIPLLGALFRSTEKVKVKMERLFLITPKVIEY